MQVYTRLDQPQAALQQYKRVAAEQAGQTDMLLGQARIYDAINDIETGVTLYKEVTLLCAALSFCGCVAAWCLSTQDLGDSVGNDKKQDIVPHWAYVEVMRHAIEMQCSIAHIAEPCVTNLMCLGCLSVREESDLLHANFICFGQVLRYDASNIEAIACLGSFHFYSDQPEVSMMYLRRILQMGKLAVETKLCGWHITAGALHCFPQEGGLDNFCLQQAILFCKCRC